MLSIWTSLKMLFGKELHKDKVKRPKVLKSKFRDQ